MTDTGLAIEVDKLLKRYPNGHVANFDIDLKVHEGEFFTLLGPNGAGKSTLIKQITSEIKPTGGRVRVLDIDVQRNPVAAKKNMGIMPQECGLFEHLTVEQHLQIFSKLKGVDWKSGTSHNLVENLEIGKHRKKRIGDLSIGLRRQILLVTALIGDPPVLVLDEPTTGLDPEARSIVLKLLLNLRKNKRTIFLTTHLMDEAEFLSDRVGIIVGGRIVHCGNLETLRSKIDRQFVLRLRLKTGEYVFERFTDYHDAFNAFSANEMKDFSLSTITLETVYFDLVKSIDN